MNSTKIRAYVLVVAALAALSVARGSWVLDATDPSSARNCVAALFALAVLAEVFSFSLRVGTVTSSVAFVPYLATILLVGPTWAMLVAGATEFLAEAVVRRKPAIKILHNTGKELLAVGAAGWSYTALGGATGLHSFELGVAPFAVAVFIYFMLSTGATTIAVTLSGGESLVASWNRVVGRSLVYDAFSSSLAVLLAFLYVKFEIAGLLLVIVPLFFVRHTYHVNLQLEQVNRDLLELMVKAIEARDPYTSGHSLRVSLYARALGQAAGLSGRQLDNVETAALLHDVGKIHEEYAPLLRKEGKLTPEEFILMKNHPVRSHELVRTISRFRGDVELAVRHHHEDHDGRGYPDGLKGEAIPLGARIIRIADTTDAMTTDRPYRAAMTYERVVSELREYANVQFDPDLVDAFCRSTALRALLSPTRRSDEHLAALIGSRDDLPALARRRRP